MATGNSLFLSLNQNTVYSDLSVDFATGIFTMGGDITMAGADSVTYLADSIKDTDIDWAPEGAAPGAGQVSGVDVPIQDVGNWFGTDNVEAALQELGADVDSLQSGLVIKDNVWTSVGPTFDDTDGLRQTQAVLLTGNVAAGEKFYIDDNVALTETYTATAGAPGAFQFQVGATINATVANLVASINANSALAKAEYSLVDDIHATTYLIGIGAQDFLTGIYTWAATAGGAVWTNGQPKYSKDGTDIAAHFTNLANVDPAATNFQAGVAAAGIATGWTYVVRAGAQSAAWLTYNQTTDHWTESSPHRTPGFQAGKGIDIDTNTSPWTISVVILGVDSTGGANGEVLTADGAGGVDWIAPGVPATPTLQEAYDASSPPTITLDASGDLLINLNSATAGDAFKVASSAGGADGLTLTSTGADAMSMVADTTTTALSSSSTTDIDAAGTMSFNVTGGNILNIQSDAAAASVNVGTGAAVIALNAGSSNGASSTSIHSGTGGANFATDANAHTTTVGSGNTTSTTTLDSGTGGTNIGTTANAHEVTIGSATGASGITANMGTGGVDIGTNAVAGTITVGNSTGATSIVAEVGTGNLDLGVNAVAHEVRIGSATGAAGVTVNTGTGGIDIGTNGVAATIIIGNNTGATALNLETGSGGLQVDADGNSAVTIAGTADVDTTGAVNLQTSSGTFNVTTDPVATTTTIGNATGATSTVLDVGTGNLDIGVTATAHEVRIGSATGASGVTMNTGTGGVDIATNAVAAAVTIGNNTGATSLNLETGSGGLQVDADGNSAVTVAGTVDLDSTGAVNFQTTSGTANLFTDAAAATVTIGNNTGASTVALETGSGGLQVDADGNSAMTFAGTLDVDSTGAVNLQTSSGTASLFTDAVATTTTIGNGTGATTTTLDVGTGGLNLGTNATAHEVTIGSGTGASGITANMGTGGMDLGANAVAGTITIGNNTGATALNLETGSGGLNVDSDGNSAMTFAGTLDVDTTGTVNLQTSSGTASLFTDAVATTLTLGNGTGATTVTLDTGTGGVNVGTNATAHEVSIGSGTGASGVTMNTGTGGVDIATNAVAAKVTIGNATGATEVQVDTGSGGFDANVGGDTDINSTGTTTITNGTGDLKLENNAAGAGSDIIFELGGSAGAEKVLFNDATSATKASVDSDGNSTFLGSVTIGALGEFRMTDRGPMTLVTSTSGSIKGEGCKLTGNFTVTKTPGQTGEQDKVNGVFLATEAAGPTWMYLSGSMPEIKWNDLAAPTVGMPFAPDGLGGFVKYTTFGTAGKKLQYCGVVASIAGYVNPGDLVSAFFNPDNMGTLL